MKQNAKARSLGSIAQVAPRLHCCTSVVALVTVMLILLSGIGDVSYAAAAAGNTITVCPAGPPACDFMTIQAAIDAAGPGDTVVAAAGVYTGTVDLKSHLVLRSADGPGVTSISAANGPILTAHGVVSTTVEGFDITGNNAAAVGMDLLDADLDLTNCSIRDIRSADGTAGHPDGQDAVAIQITGTVRLAIVDSMIQNVVGGNGLLGAAASGGKASGVRADGEGAVIVSGTSIRQMNGGDPGTQVLWPYNCGGSGGTTTGIWTDGSIALSVTDTLISDLIGGKPCFALANYCIEGAGAVTGIRATGGSATILGSQLARLSGWPAHRSQPNFGIRTSRTLSTNIGRTSISTVSAAGAAQVQATASPDSPYCGPPGGTMIAISSEGDASLEAADNVVASVDGLWIGGRAAGIVARGTSTARLRGNSISGVMGGSYSVSAIGIQVTDASSAEITTNTIRNIHGGGTPPFGYRNDRVDGGSAVGIRLETIAQSRVDNNLIWSLEGGPGNEIAWSGQPSFGGDATAISLTQAASMIANNTTSSTTGGSGQNGGRNGAAVGIALNTDTDASLINNAIVKHGVGISATTTRVPLLGYNDLWANQNDYVGLAPGASDLHIDPAFVAENQGDLHLKSFSPLIDAGTDVGAPSHDLDGKLRPLDGNRDGIARTDVGAYEYWSSLDGSTKVVDRSVAKPGDILTYGITLLNASGQQAPLSITLTDTIPANTAYIIGSLHSSAGQAVYSGGAIMWSGSLASGESVTISFRVTIDSSLVGPQAIINEALLDDHVGMIRKVSARTLVNPVMRYLPLIFRS